MSSVPAPSSLSLPQGSQSPFFMGIRGARRNRFLAIQQARQKALEAQNKGSATPTATSTTTPPPQPVPVVVSPVVASSPTPTSTTTPPINPRLARFQALHNRAIPAVAQVNAPSTTAAAAPVLNLPRMARFQALRNRMVSPVVTPAPATVQAASS